MTFEQALNRLMEIVENLEQNNTDLEKSLSLYKEGLAISKYCTETLNRYENEVLLLQKESEGLFATVSFDTL